MVIDNDGRAASNRSVEERLARLEMGMEFIFAENKETRQELIRIREEMRSDFRILFGALIFITLGLTAVLSKGFGWI